MTQFNFTIATERLVLRPFEDNDAGAIFDMAMQPGFHFLRLWSTERYVPELGRNPMRDDVWQSSVNLIKHCQDEMQVGDNGLPNELKMAVCLKADVGKVIGYRSLGALLDPERDIGACIHPQYQCNGYSSESGRGIIGGFHYLVQQNPELFETDCCNVSATVHPHNTASQKALCHMQFENTGMTKTTMVQGIEEPRLCFILPKERFLGVAFNATYQRN